MDIFSKATGTHDSSSPVEQLRSIMDDVESFLAGWLQRIEQLNEIAATPDAFIRKRIHELEQERVRWEAKRNRETKEIHHKAEELAEAWLRLEQEQRRFVQTRDSQSRPAQSQNAQSQNAQTQSAQSRATQSTSLRAMPAEVSTERHDVAETQSAPRSSVKPPSIAIESAIESTPTLSKAKSRLPSPLQGTKAGALAIEQFEQLRREIETSRRSRPA